MAIPSRYHLQFFILLINGRVGHEGQQSPHDRINLKYKVIFVAPLVHTDVLLADITSTPHNPTLSRYRPVIEPNYLLAVDQYFPGGLQKRFRGCGCHDRTN